MAGSSPHRGAAGGRRAGRRPVEDPVNHERWLVSYADFITLLFAFFTMMYAMSTLDSSKMRTAATSVQSAFEPAARTRGDGQVASASSGGVIDTGIAELQRQVQRRLAGQLASRQIDVGLDGRGLVISIMESGSFAVGSADLSPSSQALLVEVGSVLSGVDNPVRVEGHTDDVPIHSARFASNWDLSTARATRVIAFLLEHSSIEPGRLSAAGYAEQHPRAPNHSDSARALNRRVDLVVLNQRTGTAEEPAPPGGCRPSP
jgi:chemotaxis protein MotB